MPDKEEKTEENIAPVVSKMSAAVINLYEKVCRDYQLTIDEAKASTITICDGEVTVKMKGKK